MKILIKKDTDNKTNKQLEKVIFKERKQQKRDLTNLFVRNSNNDINNSNNTKNSDNDDDKNNDDKSNEK